MPFSWFILRFSALAALLLAPLAVACAPASAETGDVYVHAGANFKPVTVAVTPFVGEGAGDKIGAVVGNDFARSIFLLPLNPASFPKPSPIRTSARTSTRGRRPMRNSF